MRAQAQARAQATVRSRRRTTSLQARNFVAKQGEQAARAREEATKSCVLGGWLKAKVRDEDCDELPGTVQVQSVEGQEVGSEVAVAARPSQGEAEG